MSTVTIKQKIKSFAENYLPIKLLYAIGLKRPVVLNNLGMGFFQETSTWRFDPKRCPCDLYFVEYIHELKIHGKNIFHFGTGEHHLIGLENQKLAEPNEIMGITASALEQQSYIKLVIKDSSLSKFYKVLFGDIYTLTARNLPMFDIVTLFHLCEFYIPENAPLVHQNDESLIQLFLDKLNPEGHIIFYTGSFAWGTAKSIVESFVEAGKIKKTHEYKTLLFYSKTENF